MQATKKARGVKSRTAVPNVDRLLDQTLKGKNLLKRRKGAKLFLQGRKADAIYFIQAGKIQLTVVSPEGKKVVLATMGPHDFFGEECLVGNSRRTSTAATLEPSTIFRVRKEAMLQAIHLQPALSQKFVASLVARNVNMEEELCDQLFNHGELRLACALLKLSRGSHPARPRDVNVPGVTNKKLAKMVGTTPSKIIFFMNKFRNLGLIDYKGDGPVEVKTGLLTDMVLHP